MQSCGDSFVESYAPIVERRKGLPYSAEQKRWQQMRRGRYVEFNLVWDRGTKFVRHNTVTTLPYPLLRKLHKSVG